MLTKIKYVVKRIINNKNMIVEYYYDYLHYKKWNYNNPAVNSRTALESKILRQSHMIEKGMSLSSPRKGFGEKKIEVLFQMMDNYLSLGYPKEGVPFQNSILVLLSYVEMQKKMGYENKKIIQKLNSFLKYVNSNLSAGIKYDNRSNLLKSTNLPFPKFFESRHSIRQFDDTEINMENLKKAIRIAQKAPTACNRQATKVYFYSNKDTNRMLGNLIAGNTGFENEIKNYLVITADVSAFYDSFERNQVYIEAGLFSMALVQALHYYGIGSCILQNGEYHSKNIKMKNILNNIPESERIILFIAIGNYKDEFSYAISLRKDLDDIFIVM